MDWQSVITTVATSATAIGAIAWTAKALISHWLTRDTDRFKASLLAEHSHSLEKFRADLQIEAQRQHIVFGSLHARRAQVIADLYGMLDGLHRSVQRVRTEKWVRDIREDTDRQLGRAKQPGVLRPGYEELDADEKQAVDDLRRVAFGFQEFLGPNRIYFSPEACDCSIDSGASRRSSL